MLNNTGELGLEIPEIQIGLDDFFQGTISDHVGTGLHTQEVQFQQMFNRPYPWIRRLLERNGDVIQNPFPELDQIVDSLPIAPETRNTLLLFCPSTPDNEFRFHFDNDDIFGFRICLGLNTNLPFMELKEIKSENIGKTGRVVELDMLEETSYYIKPTKSNTVLTLPGSLYPHRAIASSITSPIVVLIVTGKILESGNDWIEKNLINVCSQNI